MSSSQELASILLRRAPIPEGRNLVDLLKHEHDKARLKDFVRSSSAEPEDKSSFAPSLTLDLCDSMRRGVCVRIYISSMHMAEGMQCMIVRVEAGEREDPECSGTIATASSEAA